MFVKSSLTEKIAGHHLSCYTHLGSTGLPLASSTLTHIQKIEGAVGLYVAYQISDQIPTKREYPWPVYKLTNIFMN